MNQDRLFSSSRRSFISTSSSAVAGLSIAGGLAHQVNADGPRAKDRLRLAGIGVGGMGASDLASLSSHAKVDVVALCDVDENRLAEASKKHPNAKIYRDYRVMLQEMNSEIDAVHVSTPDHTHAPAAMTAMLKNKHVYCQKPLTHDVFEARQLAKIAAERDLVTQMGTQIHSAREYRTAVKLVQSGAIGKVREVHSWSSKTWGYEGPIPKPNDVPANLDWELWLGTAPFRPYSQGHYHPADWRRWCDFGCGTMGDMAIHILDPVFTALQIGAPKSIISHSDTPASDSYGMQNAVEYIFPGSAFTAPELKLTWHDGGAMPDASNWPVAKNADSKQADLPDQGSMFMGEKGFVLLPHVEMPRLLPSDQFQGYKIEEVQGGNHYHLWVDACLGGAPTTAGFDYAGPVTEAVLLGVLANRYPHQKLEWDAKSMKINGVEDANNRLRRKYRSGFEVENLS